MSVIKNERLVDTELELKDAGLVAADAAGTVDSSAAYVDFGSAAVEGYLIIEVTACEVASGDEQYLITLQGDSSSAFATALVTLATLHCGDATQIAATADVGVGRYVIPFTNVFAGTIKRYVRIYTDVTGTIATGINFTAKLSI